MDTLDANEAAALLHMQAKRVRSLAREGKLPAMRVGRRWLFRRGDLEGALRPRPSPPSAGFDLSARNRLRGRVVELRIDGLMAELVLDIGGQELVSVITRSSAERLGLRVGAPVLAVIKSTEVMIGREE
jgi:molybdopterin-binding protein